MTTAMGRTSPVSSPAAANCRSIRSLRTDLTGKLHNVDVALYGGVATKAKIISLKTLDANGAGYTSTVIDAIEFAIDNKDKLGIDVINLSLGHPILEPAATDPLVQAVEAAVRAGIVVVASAGNYGINPKLCRRDMPASRRPAMPRPRLLWARSIRNRRRRDPTTPFPAIARADRHGTTRSPSPTLSRLAISWCRMPPTGRL